MQHASQKGFTSLATLFLASLLLSLGGVGTVLGVQQQLPQNIREEFRSFLESNDLDELFPTPTISPTDATGVSGPTGASGVIGPSGATGTTGVTPTLTITPKPTEVEDQEDEIEDDDEDENGLEDDDDNDHATGATGAQINATGRIEKHEDDED